MARKPFSRQDLELDKFDQSSGETCVRVCGNFSSTPADPPSENPLIGDTIVNTGTVGVAFTDVPSVAGGVITSFLLESPPDNDTKELMISLDGGTTFKTLKSGSNFVWTPRGGLTQVKLKGSAAGTEYEIVFNRNDP